jgi:LPS sulfotransferase NodH
MPLTHSIFFRNQVSPFVILFVERDGSTYLTSLLQTHPEIEAVYERFAVMVQKEQSGAEQLAWAREFWTPPFAGRKAAYGFKTKLVDVLDLPGFRQLLREKRVKIIHMQRENRIKAVVSRINARRLYEATGNWNLYKEQDRRPPMTVDIEEFHRFVREREEADRTLAEFVSTLALPTELVKYEELQSDKDGVIQRVSALLRVRPLPLEGKTKKHTKDDLREVITNFDALRDSFAGTPYEAMFTEVLKSEE